MRFEKTRLEGAYLIDPEKHEDRRGFFSRFFCEKEFSEVGLETRFPQINNSFTFLQGTLRGLHYQVSPNAEAKLMRCVRGAMYDVIVDLRPWSPTYLNWFGTELTGENRRMLYVPRGFAHGFLSITDEVEVIYLSSSFYEPKSERGLRWDDPTIGIDWPIKPVEITEKDRSWPDFSPTQLGLEGLGSER